MHSHERMKKIKWRPGSGDFWESANSYIDHLKQLLTPTGLGQLFPDRKIVRNGGVCRRRMRPRIFGIWAVLGKVWRQSLYGICQGRDGSDPILKVLPSSKAKNCRNSIKINIIPVVE